jgi:hypothetical protein
MRDSAWLFVSHCWKFKGSRSRGGVRRKEQKNLRSGLCDFITTTKRKPLFFFLSAVLAFKVRVWSLLPGACSWSYPTSLNLGGKVAKRGS